MGIRATTIRSVHRTLLGAAALAAALPAAAVPFDPADYVSLGSLDGSAIAIDTSALTLNGGAGGVLVSQGGTAPDIAVFTFDDASILGDVVVTGTNALAILFRGAGTVSGAISVGSTDRFGIAGGRDGGGQDSDGDGPGGGRQGRNGVNTNATGGGGGGSFGSAGQPTDLGPGGAPYGDPLSATLEAGSGGGGGGRRTTSPYEAGAPGGAGGGALEIGALTSLVFDGSASVLANGADGADAGPGQITGGGGGSGGGLLIHAFDVEILAGALLAANGGLPGNFLLGESGTCSGAGRIEVLYNTGGAFQNAGTVMAAPSANHPFCNPGAINVFSVLAADDIGGQPVGVPAPATALLVGLGLAGLGFTRHQRRPNTPIHPS